MAYRIAHDDGDEPGAELACDGDRAAPGLRLDSVIDRVLEEGLQHESRHESVARQRVDAPQNAQARTQPQLLDPLINAGDLQLVRERDDVTLFAQVGAKQIGQILYGLFRLCRIGARERCDRVHAVEEKMRPDTCLQSMYACRRLHLHVTLPLVSHIEVAQCQRRHHYADRYVAQYERPGLHGKQALPAQISRPPHAAESVRAERDHRDESRDQRENGDRSARHAQAPQGGPHPTQQAGAGEPDPH